MPEKKETFLDTKSSRCMAISGIAHIVGLIVLYIMMLPAGGSEGEDFIDVSFESVVEEVTSESFSENSEYTPDLSENIENITDNVDFSDDGAEEAEFLQEQYEKLQKQNQQAAENNEKINEGIVKRSKYGPLLPKHFYGIRIFARSIIFIIDVSGSMDIPEAILQLRNAYHTLSPEESFSIIMYSSNAKCWKEETVPATEENKKEADIWLKKSIVAGGTNMYDGLKKGFEIARANLDTIFFLTDGQPTEGKVKTTDGLLQEVTMWNSQKNIIINTIGLGRHQASLFLEKLAAQNGGVYYQK